MAFYANRIYPHLVRLLGNPEPIRRIREKLLSQARGSILEIGVGPGVNFIHYDPAKVEKIYALEPNPGMLRFAEREGRRTALRIEYLRVPGERIPLAEGTVDTVVSTFTFCSVPGLMEAISAVRKVLQPAGKLIFFEHGCSPDPRVRRWQARLEPMSRCVFNGCHLTRDIPALLRQGGFEIEEMETAYLASFPKALTYCWWGTAVPQIGSSAQEQVL